MISRRKFCYLIILVFLYCVLDAYENDAPNMDVKVNYLGDAQAYYIIQATWLPDKPDSLITIFFNSDNKTFWRYVINEYNPVSDVYTTLFEEQENSNFYIKLFYYHNGDMRFLKKFLNNPMDTKDYMVRYEMNNRKRTVKLLGNEKLQDGKNMLGREIKGRLVDCTKYGCLRESDNKFYFVRVDKDKKPGEVLLFENVTEPYLIAGTNLAIFKKQGDYFIYSIDLKKVLYKLNFIESYSKFKVDVINLLAFDPQGKYILFETTGKYKGRNKKSVGTLAKQIFK